MFKSGYNLRAAGLILLILLTMTIFGCRQGDSPPGIENNVAPTEPVVLAPVPSPTAKENQILEPIPTIDPERRPELGISVSAETADGAFWYAFDRFDSIGGVPPGSRANGLYRLIDGEVSHFEIPGTIRVLEPAEDGSLYIGAGCGLMRWDGNQLETIVEVDCDDSNRPVSLHAIDIAFGSDGNLWIGEAHKLASYNGEVWEQYDVSALRVTFSADDTLWALGWDGHRGSQCCLANLTPSGIVTYSWSADVPQEIVPSLFGANGR